MMQSSESPRLKNMTKRSLNQPDFFQDLAGA